MVHRSAQIKTDAVAFAARNGTSIVCQQKPWHRVSNRTGSPRAALHVATPCRCLAQNFCRQRANRFAARINCHLANSACLADWLRARALRLRVSKLTVMTITMYGADWCGDCRRAEKFFVDNNIEFQKIDLELDEVEPN